MIWLTVAFATTFTPVPTSAHSHGFSAGSGLGVADVDHDGWLDVVFSHYGDAHLYVQDPTTPFVFTDETARAPGFSAITEFGRGVLVVDFDNDGNRDVALMGMREISVLFGTGATEGDLFVQGPLVLDGGPDGPAEPPSDAVLVSYLNVEGMVPYDFDGDGLFEIQTGERFHRLEGLTTTPVMVRGADGLPDDSGQSDDHLMIEDIDGDRHLDVFSPRRLPLDSDTSIWTALWFGGPSGWTRDDALQMPTQPQKGGTLLCDFDGDGDLDLLRTVWDIDGSGSQTGEVLDGNQVWLFDNGAWVSAGNPGIDDNRSAYPASCGDIDNDGDLDLAVGYIDGEVALLRNDGTGQFTEDAGGIPEQPGRVSSLVLADFDRDGALDVYAHVSDSPDVIYENTLVSEDFVAIELLANAGTCAEPILVDDTHGQVRVRPSTSADWGPRVVLYGAHGNGMMTGNPLHVGTGPLQPGEALLVDVLPGRARVGGGLEASGQVWVDPSAWPYRQVTVRTDDLDGDGIPNTLEGADASPPLDTDGDGTPDYLSWDADGDGIADLLEVGDPCEPFDLDGDGTPDFQDTDADGDGDPDEVDCAPLDDTNVRFLVYPDLDGDGHGSEPGVLTCSAMFGHTVSPTDCDDEDPTRHPDAEDVPDNGLDEDCDGQDTLYDQDGDGIPDEVEGTIDTDEDGIPDLLDIDSDNDGVLDADEPSEEARTDSSLPPAIPTPEPTDDPDPEPTGGEGSCSSSGSPAFGWAVLVLLAHRIRRRRPSSV